MLPQPLHREKAAAIRQALYLRVSDDIAPYAPFLSANDPVRHTDQSWIAMAAGYCGYLHLAAAVFGYIAGRAGDKLTDRAIDAALDGMRKTAQRVSSEYAAAANAPPAPDEAAKVAATAQAADAALAPLLPYLAGMPEAERDAAIREGEQLTQIFLQRTLYLPPPQAADLARAFGETLRASANLRQ